MLVKLSIILSSNSHNFTYYAHRFYLLYILKIILGLMLMALQTANNILQIE